MTSPDQSALPLEPAGSRGVPAPPPAVVASVFPTTTEEINRYVDILASRGIDWGLLGPREADRLWDRHVLNCAALARVVPRDAFVVDVGSGAGMPGIPLALARPDLTITLLEPLQRRAEFLKLAVKELVLGDRVRVVRQRAEQHPDYYDVVTSRAVANLAKLIDWCAPLLDDAGQILALKGERVHAEVVAASGRLEQLGMVADVLTVQAHPETEPTYICRVRRN